MQENRYKFIPLENTPLPATCVSCNLPATQQRLLVDTGTSLDFFGAVLLCGTCITAMAHLVQLVPADQMNKLMDTNADLLDKLAESKEKIEALENVVFTYFGPRDSSSPDNRPSNSSSVASPKPSEDSPESDPIPDGADRQREIEVNGPVKSVAI